MINSAKLRTALAKLAEKDEEYEERSKKTQGEDPARKKAGAVLHQLLRNRE